MRSNFSSRSKKYHYQIWTLVWLVFISGCYIQGKINENELIIFAASSLTNAFEELANKFEETHPSINIVLNFGSSAQLAAQILAGAKGDIFASANTIQMEIVQNAGELRDFPIVFCTNSLVIGVPFNNPHDINSLQDLGNQNLRIVLAIPNTPIRDYSDTLVKTYLSEEDQENFFRNVQSEETNARQMVTKIAIGEADAGIIYSSDITPNLSKLLKAIPIPENQNILAQYLIGILRNTNNHKLSEEFIQFVLSDEGQSTLRKWGFLQ